VDQLVTMMLEEITSKSNVKKKREDTSDLVSLYRANSSLKKVSAFICRDFFVVTLLLDLLFILL
jgi:hypothetical protein